MLKWHQAYLEAPSPEEALRIARKHNINDQDDNGMTLLMHLVMHKKYNAYTKILLQSSEATPTALRKDLDLNVVNKNGEDAFLLAKAAKNTEIEDRIDIETTRKRRIQSQDKDATYLGYHDTSGEAFAFIQKDRANKKFPMVGGSGGYFGGGIYFAATKEESTVKALSHGRGFECRLKMGNIYKISSLVEKKQFHQTYFGTSDDTTRPWYETPSDVIRMRLLTIGGNAYDSVWGHYDEELSNTDDRILPTGDEYVVYSADQVHIQDTFTIFYNHWLSNTIQTPPIHDFYKAIPLKWGDVYIEHRKKYVNDTIMFAYEEGSKRRFTNTATHDDAFELPLEISKHIQNCVQYYKPIFHILDRMDVPSNDAYVQTLFPTIPSDTLENVLKNYQIILEPVEHSILFSRMDTGRELIYDLNKDFLLKDRSELVFSQLSQSVTVVSIAYNVTVYDHPVEVELPDSFIKSLDRFLASEEATKSSFENELEIVIKEGNESTFIPKLQTMIETYLHRKNSTRRSTSPKRSTSPLVMFQPTASQRSSAKYFVTERVPVPNETYQHGDIIGWKQNELRLWFYIRPTMDKEGTFLEKVIDKKSPQCIIPPEVTRYLLDAQTYYKDLLSNPKWIKADPVFLTLSPNDVFWKNEKIFKPKVLEAIGTLLDAMRQRQLVYLNYSTDFTFMKKSRSIGYFLIHHYAENRKQIYPIKYKQLFSSKEVIRTFTDIYWNPKPLEITIDLSIQSSTGKQITITDVYKDKNIQSLVPNQPMEWTIEPFNTLTLKLPRYSFSEIYNTILEQFKSGEWLPFGASLEM